MVRISLSRLRNLYSSAAEAGASRALNQFLNSLGRSTRRLLSNPRSFILTVVVGYVVTNFIRPPIRAVVVVTGQVASAIEAAALSIAGIPSYVATALGGGLGAAGGTLIATVTEYNQAVQALAADAGITGLPIVTVLFVIEMLVGGWLLVFAIRALIENVDVPFISLEGLANLVVRPVRAVAGFVLGVFR
jgi:hypothetical protein